MGDIHLFEQQPLLILCSLHSQRQGIPRPSRLKLERMYYSAMTGSHNGYLYNFVSHPNGWLHALGGCGVSTVAKQQIPMRVKKLEKRAD